MKQAHVFISGFVQGVGFRAFIQYHANRLGITGWVRNTEEEGVEAVLQSSASSDQEAKEAIEQMIQLCKKGHMVAEVEDVKVEWETIKEKYERFEVVL